MTISISHGHAAMSGGAYLGGFYGAGFGKDKELSEIAVHLGELLSSHYPNKHFEIRCNTDGESCGAHNDEKYGFSLRVDRRESVLRYTAGFSTDTLISKSDVPNVSWIYIPPKKSVEGKLVFDEEKAISVWSIGFKTPQTAFNWLLEWGAKFCPALHKEVKQSVEVTA